MSSLNSSLTIRNLKHRRLSGQSATEYILLIAFITLVGVSVASMMGSSIQGLLSNINAQLQAALGTKPPPSNPAGN